MFEPFGNTTTLPPTQWHPEPLVRGTYSILSSCLITMSLCIWTSLHLNLPAHKKEHLQKYRKLGWMILGLLAPELVVWNAREQRRRANGITQRMKDKHFMPRKTQASKCISEWFSKAYHDTKVAFLCEAGDLPDSERALPSVLYNGHVNAWTNVHSWFVVMGGLVFEDSNSGTPRFMPRGRQHVAINPEMFLWIVEMQPDLVPDISINDIEDKSKSDWLAKTLTCGQASYFCIQCIFRLSQSLSITLLELNVFAHALCALLLFLVWWDKPRDIYNPLSITGEKALDICACMIMGKSGEWYQRSIDLAALDFRPTQEWFEITGPRQINLLILEIEDLEQECLAILGTQVYHSVKIGEAWWNVDLLARNYLKTSISDQLSMYATIDTRDFERLRRASRIAARSPSLIRSICKMHICYHISAQDRNPDWHLNPLVIGGSYVGSDSIWLLSGITFAGACYGGLHITAWTNQFPSYAETILWRAATITILATGPFCALLSLCIVIDSALPLAPIPNLVRNFLAVLCALLLGSVLLWYVLCRAFIVVECFILMAHIPTSALVVPTWAAYIPHIS